MKYQIAIIILTLTAVNLFIFRFLYPFMEELPVTKVWYSFAWMEIITQIGIGAIWFKIKNHERNNRGTRFRNSNFRK